MFYEEDEYANGLSTCRKIVRAGRPDRETVAEPDDDLPGDGGFESPVFWVFLAFMILLMVVCTLIAP